ncbi:poly-beta-hydroxybutyrate polymerase N-terminal domain-containing protein [Mesorhizobium atlanticum]
MVAVTPAPLLPDEGSASVYRDVDRLSHALVAAFTAGISPISLLQAWQDWLLHAVHITGKAGRGLHQGGREACQVE